VNSKLGANSYFETSISTQRKKRATRQRKKEKELMQDGAKTRKTLHSKELLQDGKEISAFHQSRFIQDNTTKHTHRH
jgi:hypothetical protein